MAIGSRSARFGSAGLGLFLREAYRTYGRELEKRFAKYQITQLQFTLLWLLSDEGPYSQVDLATRAGIRRASATDDLEVLKRRKLIRGQRDPDDKRKIILSLTVAGSELVGLLAEEAAHTNTVARGEMSKTTYRHLFDLLNEVTANLNNSSRAQLEEETTGRKQGREQRSTAG
jgi:DNA-binding MarR family transcriptional regulator